MGIKKELGKKIKYYRIRQGYTQEKLSEIINISQKALSSIEAGTNFISAETFDKIMIALGITAEELFATNNVKDSEALVKMINENLAKIGDDSYKLELVYNLTKSLSK